MGRRKRGREGGKTAGGTMISRGRFLKLAEGAVGAASLGLLSACEGATGEGSAHQTPGERQEVGSLANQGRLLARPTSPSAGARVPAGLRPLGLGAERDGLLYVPAGYDASEKTPLALTLHAAGGAAKSGISHFLDLADEAGVVLLAHESRDRTWDVLVGGYGPDVAFIDRALERVFDRLAVDARRLAITGFSDGASDALSLGLTNGDLFTHLIAFSPGFLAPSTKRGKPPVFVSHGNRDGGSRSRRRAAGSCRNWSATITRCATGSSTAHIPCPFPSPTRRSIGLPQDKERRMCTPDGAVREK
jgi:phospholipase/carboxylesterase